MRHREEHILIIDCEKHQRLRGGTREFLEEKSPTARVIELFDHPQGFDRRLWKHAAFLGWYGMLISERFGGFKLTSRPLLDLAVIAEEHGRLVQPGPLVPTNVVAYAINQFGTEEQRREHLLAIASGETIATWCLAEDPRSWELTDLAVTAAVTDNGFVVNGIKVCVQDAEAADLLLVTARTESGLVQLLIPARPRGVTLWPRSYIDRTRRLYDVQFDDVFVPATAQLGGYGDVEQHVEQQLRIAKVLQCAESAAGAARLVERCLAYPTSRERHTGGGRTCRHTMADLILAAEIASTAARNAASAAADLHADAAVAIDVAEIVVNDVYAFIAAELVRIFGDDGLTHDSELEVHLRRAQGNQLMFGSADAHREHLRRLVGCLTAGDASRSR